MMLVTSCDVGFRSRIDVILIHLVAALCVSLSLRCFHLVSTQCCSNQMRTELVDTFQDLLGRVRRCRVRIDAIVSLVLVLLPIVVVVVAVVAVAVAVVVVVLLLLLLVLVVLATS